MPLRRSAFGVWCAGGLAAQTFIKMSAPQFGMYSKNQGFEHETAVFLDFTLQKNVFRRPRAL